MYLQNVNMIDGFNNNDSDVSEINRNISLHLRAYLPVTERPAVVIMNPDAIRMVYATPINAILTRVCMTCPSCWLS